MTVERARPGPPTSSLPVLTEQRDQHGGMGRQKQETLNALIGEQVIQTLGRPATLLKVSVRPLWQAFYRVNIFVGADDVSARVAHSFFLEADGDGNIIASTPAVRKLYGRAAEGASPLPPTGSPRKPPARSAPSSPTRS